MREKPLLVLLHGWASTAEVWQLVQGQLERYFKVQVVMLPGHGETALPQGSIEQIAQAIWQSIAQPVYLLGWSLGGLVALQMAIIQPRQVRALLWVATTPAFVQNQQWTCAMSHDTFDQFYKAYCNNPTAALDRFVALQVHGDHYWREVLPILKTSRSQGSDLIWGLDMLRDVQLFDQLAKLPIRVYGLYGQADALIPATLSTHLPHYGVHTTLWSSCGHAPFLSRPTAFIAWVKKMVEAKP